MKYFIYAVILIVAASVVAGFFIVGSPQEERLRRFDEQRVQDLQFLQAEILNFWQAKGKLPERLSDIKDDLRGIFVSRDPQTGDEYGYAIRGTESFELCAIFVRPSIGSSEAHMSKPALPRGEPFVSGQNWEHGAGEACFKRTIDKDFYKIKPR